MNYKKKYNEALKWMHKLYPELHGATKEDAEHYFPELKESEDERIRTRLIALVESFGQGTYKNEMLAYLEKQKEQKPAEWSEENKEIMHDIIKYHYDQGEISSKHNKWASWLEHKSFSLQSHWKPSEEQMKALKNCVNGWSDNADGILESLYKDLKKL